MPRPKIEIDKAELMMLHRMRTPRSRIAAHFGCTDSTIGNRLRKLGIFGRYKPCKGRREVALDEDELVGLHASGMTQEELGIYFDCSGVTIGKRLRRLGLSTAPAGERMDGDGYADLKRRGHPHARADGYVRRSILMWEAYHGRPFPRDRVPHHLDGDRLNDNPTNLLSLLPSEHTILEAWIRRERGRNFAKRAE